MPVTVTWVCLSTSPQSILVGMSNTTRLQSNEREEDLCLPFTSGAVVRRRRCRGPCGSLRGHPGLCTALARRGSAPGRGTCERGDPAQLRRAAADHCRFSLSSNADPRRERLAHLAPLGPCTSTAPGWTSIDARLGTTILANSRHGVASRFQLPASRCPLTSGFPLGAEAPASVLPPAGNWEREGFRSLPHVTRGLAADAGLHRFAAGH